MRAHVCRLESGVSPSRAFARQRERGHMTRLVADWEKGAMTSPEAGGAVCFHQPLVLGRVVTHDRFNPSLSQRNLSRLLSFPSLASLRFVSRSSLSEEPETLWPSLVRAPSSGAHSVISHRVHGHPRFPAAPTCVETCLECRQRSRAGSPRCRPLCCDSPREGAAEVRTAWRICW